MDLFTYLGAKNGKFTLPHKSDLFSYLLGKNSKLPIQTASGTTLEITAKKTNVLELTLDKMCSQTTTTQSDNLFDQEKYLTETFTTGTYKYALTNFKGNRTLYVKAQIKSGKTALSDLFLAFTTNGTNPNSGTSHFVIRYNGVNNGSIDFTGTNDIYVSYYPTSYTWEQILDVYDIWVATSDIEYTPFVPNSPSPDYPSEVNVAEGYRNLLDLTQATPINSGANTSNKQINSVDINGTSAWSNAGYYITNPKKNNNFTISCKALTSLARKTGISVYGSNSTTTSPTSIKSNQMSINANEETEISLSFNSGNYEYILIRFWCNATSSSLSSNEVLHITETQLVEGSTPLPYVPYGTNYINLNITDGVNSINKQIPLNDNFIGGIGDYKDILTIDESGSISLVKNIGKVVLNGSSDESYSVETINDLFRATATYFSNLDVVNLHTSYICNRLTYLGLGLQTQEGIANSDVVSANRCFIYINSSRLTESTLTAFRTWLSNNNLEIYYQLATPTTTPLGNIDISLFKGSNIITNSDNCNMTIKYY